MAPAPHSAAEPMADVGDAAPGEAVGSHSPNAPLVWDAPEQCPDQAQMRARVGERLGDARRPDGPWAIATVRQVPEGWNLKIRLTGFGEPSTRELTAASCAELSEAAVTLVALTLASAPAAEPSPTEEVDLEALLAETVPEPTPEPTPVPPASVPPDRGPRGAMRIDGALGSGALPGVGGAMAITPAIVWPNARLEFRGAFWGRRTIEVPGEGSRSLIVRMASLAVRACGVGVEKRWEFPMCAGIEGGLMLGQPQRVTLLHAPVRGWTSGHVSVGLTFRVHDNVAFTMSAEPWVAMNLGRFYRLDRAMHRSDRYGLRGYLGVELRFGDRR